MPVVRADNYELLSSHEISEFPQAIELINLRAQGLDSDCMGSNSM